MEKSLSTQVQDNFPCLTVPSNSRRFAVSRIDLPDLFLTDEERTFLVKQLNDGIRFVHIGEETISASSIKAISPRFSTEEMQERIKRQELAQQMKKAFEEKCA